MQSRGNRAGACGGTADVLPESGSEVWGVVYELDDCELRVLDGFEDGYGREKKYVDPINGSQSLEAWVYVAEKEISPPRPNGLYKRLIVEGARHWGLPQGYIEMLEKLEVTTE